MICFHLSKSFFEPYDNVHDVHHLLMDIDKSHRIIHSKEYITNESYAIDAVAEHNDNHLCMCDHDEMKLKISIFSLNHCNFLHPKNRNNLNLRWTNRKYFVSVYQSRSYSQTYVRLIQNWLVLHRNKSADSQVIEVGAVVDSFGWVRI